MTAVTDDFRKAASETGAAYATYGEDSPELKHASFRLASTIAKANTESPAVQILITALVSAVTGELVNDSIEEDE